MEFVVETVVPHFFHVFPVLDDSVVDWAAHEKDSFFGCDLVADVLIFLVHSDHHSGLFGAADEGWEAGLGRVVTGNASFDVA